MNNRGIQSRLFVSYISLILAFAIILGGVFYLFVSSYIQNRILTTYKQLVTSASSQLDRLMTETDELAKNIIVSRLPNPEMIWNSFQSGWGITLYLNDLFFLDSTIPSGTPSQEPVKSKTELVTGVINTVNGLNYRGTEILLYDLENRMYAAPYNISEEAIRQHREEYRNTEWFGKLMEKHGNTHLISPYATNWFSSQTMYVFSLLRSFRNTQNFGHTAVIEIQQDFNKVETIIDQSFGVNAQQIKIYSADGEQIYPIDAKDKEDLTPNKLLEFTPEVGSTIIHQLASTSESNKQAMIALRSPQTGWTIIYSIDYKLLYRELYEFQLNFVWIIIVMLVLGFLLSYLVARSITKPLKLVFSAVRKRGLGFGMDKLSPQQETIILSSTEEVSQVYSAIKDTYEKLEQSMNNTIEARSREAEAHWLALQSQINPHFIRNSLSVIAAASEEGDIEKTSGMCRRLSEMLNYVSRTENSQVTLEDELEYTLDYLSMMKMRFENHLEYEVDMPQEMLQLPIPKLILQPLVENCINHGFKNCKPPWQIRISGTAAMEFFELTILDSGSGITEEKLRYIHDQILQVGPQSNRTQTRTSKGGIGLIGSITRLQLLHKERFTYTLVNHSGGGGLKISLRFLL